MSREASETRLRRRTLSPASQLSDSDRAICQRLEALRGEFTSYVTKNLAGELSVRFFQGPIESFEVLQLAVANELSALSREELIGWCNSARLGDELHVRLTRPHLVTEPLSYHWPVVFVVSSCLFVFSLITTKW